MSPVNVLVAARWGMNDASYDRLKILDPRIAVQDVSLPLFKKLNLQNVYDYAVRHRDTVARFGRFPHRNSILGRSSTNEELEFLTQADSSF